MTNESFNADQANKGTTVNNEGDGDNSGNLDFDTGNKLQQQIDVMQKRMGDKDTHITSVESENQILREKLSDIDSKLEAMGSVDDALTRMKEQNSNQDTNLDEATLKSKVKSLMAETTAEDKADANFNKVAATLTSKYGKDKVDETVRTIAAENGLMFDDIVGLAQKSPEVVYRMAGIDSTGFSVAPSHGTNVGNNIDNSKEQKLSDFSKLRKEDPKEFYKPENQKKFRELCLSK